MHDENECANHHMSSMEKLRISEKMQEEMKSAAYRQEVSHVIDMN